MSRNKKIVFFISAIFFGVSSAIRSQFVIPLYIMNRTAQTISYNTGKTFDELPRADYMGNFSRIYCRKNKKQVILCDDLSLQSMYITDSIIKSNVKRTNHAMHLLADSASIIKMEAELNRIILFVNDNKTIKGYKADSIFYLVGKKTVTDYNIYFTSVGIIADSALKNQYLDKQIVENLNAIPNGASGYGKVHFMNYPRLKNGDEKLVEWEKLIRETDKLYGHVIIYDKKNNVICFYREQFFGKAEKNPLSVKNIQKQIKNAFKEKYE